MLVQQLPQNNYLLNPWLHGANLKETFEYWQPDQYWSLSRPGIKNPSPDSQNGTAAKLGPTRFQGKGLPGTAGYLSQIFAGNPEVTDLHFSAWVETIRHDYLIGRLYGDYIANGSFNNLLWTPLAIDFTTGAYIPLTAVSTIPYYPFYKFELEGMFSAGDSLGMKITGMYLGPNG